MNLKIRITAISMSLLCMFSCYDDKGNYDYREMNDIEITVSTSSSSYALGDKIEVTPELKFALGHESADLSYEWTYDGHVIADARNLEWVADTIAQNKELRLAVLDQTTGVTYFGATTISISSTYKTDGWIVLSEKDGNSMLTFMKRATEDGVLKPVVVRDIYQQINGEPMGSQPVSVYPHWTEQWDGEDPGISWLWVAQKGGQGAVDVSGSSYQKEAVLTDLFLKGYPVDMAPQAVIDLQCLTMAVGEDGTVYTRVKDNNLLFNTGKFLNTPLASDDQGECKVDGSMIAYAPFAEQGGLLLYDKNSSRYFHITDKLDWSTSAFNSGKLLSLNVAGDFYEQHPDYARLDDMKDYNVHFLGAYNSDEYGKTAYLAIIENKASHKFYLQKFNVEWFSGSFSLSQLGTEYESQTALPAELGALIDGENHFSLFRYQDTWQYLFITKGNDLYLYYLKENRLFKCATFDAPIASIDAEYYNNRYIIVGLESGDAFILKGYTSDTSDENTIDKVVINQGQTLHVTGADGKIVLHHEKDLGSIVQVRYKPSSGNGWDGFDY